ncbi:MAG: histidine--tRNA ligase [Oscillospiraceae bacterium]|nr:histidine--tRNA ligase [Oscillospiraceae bacterium]
MKISAPRGTYDLLPNETRRWQALENKLRAAAALYGYGEIRFPVFEHTELFLRGMGETGDVVQKEMYTFSDKDGRSLTLRPEGTASAARAFIEHGLHMSLLPFKCFYIAPNFRYEKPQKGRYRQHVQFGAECFGASEPQADAEIIALAQSILQDLDVSLHLNSIGCKKCRPDYQKNLRAWLDDRVSHLCETCKTRLERNPMRVLDCKVETCAAAASDAPAAVDCLCPECADFFGRLESLLDEMGVPYVRDSRIVRGFDYYTGTVFEFISREIGAQGAVCAGGRYDGLTGELGGPPTPALGFGMGLERLLLAMEAKGVILPDEATPSVYLAPMGAAAAKICAKLCHELRRLGVTAETDLCGRGLKAQMKYADKRGGHFSAVIGDTELETGRINLKDMRTGDVMGCGASAADIAKTLHILSEVELEC